MANLEQFNDQEFLSMETFRKSGIGVKTPLWFAQEGNFLYVWTGADTGKIKRIRNNSRVNIAPCKRFGEVNGEWIAADATIDSSPAALKHVETLLRQKVGFSFLIFMLIDKIRDLRKKSQRVCVKLSPVENAQ